MRNHVPHSIARSGNVRRALAVKVHKRIDGSAQVQGQLWSVADRPYSRIELVDQLPIVGLVLHEGKSKSEHLVHELQ